MVRCNLCSHLNSICSFGWVLMDGEADSGSTPEINHSLLEEDKPAGWNPPCSDSQKHIQVWFGFNLIKLNWSNSGIRESTIHTALIYFVWIFQDPSGKPFLPLLTFCKTGNMKNDAVGKSDRNTQTLGDDVVVGDGRPKSLAALFSIQQMDHRDSISSSSGHLILPGSTSSYDTMSFRSNSTTSTRSFAFPM